MCRVYQLKGTHSKEYVYIYSIDLMHIENYIYSMGIIVQGDDNVVRMLDGLSLLDDQDQERVIRMIDTLDAADKKVKGLFIGVPNQKESKALKNRPLQNFLFYSPGFFGRVIFNHLFLLYR